MASSKAQPIDINKIATDVNGKLDRDCLSYSDTGYSVMAGASMPSETYIDLTLGASGTTYTAPANGYFSLDKTNGTSEQRAISIYNSTTGCGMRSFAPYSGSDTVVFAPCKKGDEVIIYYDCVGITNWLRFIYAQGSESEAN